MSIVTCRSHLSRGLPQLLKRRPADTLFHYIGGIRGQWSVTRSVTYSGLPLKAVSHVEITNGPLSRTPGGTSWILRGIVSNTRYVTREERGDREPTRSRFGPADANCAALIPIRKSPAWWNLAPDERREIQESRSRQFGKGISASSRDRAAFAIQPRSRRALRFRHLARVCTPRRVHFRRSSRGAACLGGMAVCRTRN